MRRIGLAFSNQVFCKSALHLPELSFASSNFVIPAQSLALTLQPLVPLRLMKRRLPEGGVKHPFLTKQEAAKFLHVSPFHIDKLLATGELPSDVNVATGILRISAGPLHVYKAAMKARQRRGMEQMTQDTAEMGLYALEAEQAEVKPKP